MVNTMVVCIALPLESGRRIGANARRDLGEERSGWPHWGFVGESVLSRDVMERSLG